ncbi:MAG TPA: xanthine dehydrogenase family protein subunit M [Thermodesulfobacteriota bacterium]|nr:xanthine dehydrogenase family protein subunit M [Thermodesulfobacteriota bacterium]
MMRFEYLEPETIEEVLTILNRYQGKSKIIAGGTDLMLQMRNKTIKPEYVIDITRIPGLDYIELDDQRGLRIGALTTIRALETSVELQRKYRVISQAASQLGSVAIRNVATVGGNLCNALPSAEMSQALVALSAQVRIVGPGGQRTIPLEGFFTGVGKTLLQPNELLLEILVPKSPPHTSGIYIKHSPRGPIDLAIVNVTVLMTMESDHQICREAKIVLGAVSPTPLRARKAEEELEGKRVDGALIDRAARVAADEAHPRHGSIRGSFEYKKEMIRVLTGRAIGELIGEVMGR